MIVKKTKFKGLLIVKQSNNIDTRGSLRETFNNKYLKKQFIFEYCTTSKKNVLRGLHFQTNPNSQGKLVECILGKVYDVILDLRSTSNTFMEWGGLELSEENKKQIWIGKGFAHGFYTLSDHAHVIYKIDNYWNKNSERTIIWNDPSLSIDWHLTEEKPLLSDKDSVGKEIKDLSKEELF